MKQRRIARPALLAFWAVQGCSPIYETQTSLVVSRETLVVGNAPVVERRVVLERTNLEADEVVVKIVEREGCRRQVVERRVVEDRIERELDKPIFALEVAAAASVPLGVLATSIEGSGGSIDGANTEEGFDVGLQPALGGALLVLGGVALTAVIVDAFAARDETKRRTEMHPIGLATVDCGASPANGISVELVLPDGSQLHGRTDATGVTRIGIAVSGSNWVDIVVAGKLAGRLLVGDEAASRRQPP